MKIPAWPTIFMLGSTLATKYFKRFPFESSWFSKGAGETECGLYCGRDGKMDGKWCHVKKIAQMLGRDRYIIGSSAVTEEYPWQVSIREFTNVQYKGLGCV